jgi:4-amino-4-deoxychorismate lyase
VFDTAKLIDGHIYQIAEHLDRFLWSSGKAGIQPPMTLEQMTRTILDTAAASNAANGERHAMKLHYLSVAPSECIMCVLQLADSDGAC